MPTPTQQYPILEGKRNLRRRKNYWPLSDMAASDLDTVINDQGSAQEQAGLLGTLARERTGVPDTTGTKTVPPAMSMDEFNARLESQKRMEAQGYKYDEGKGAWIGADGSEVKPTDYTPQPANTPAPAAPAPVNTQPAAPATQQAAPDNQPKQTAQAAPPELPSGIKPTWNIAKKLGFEMGGQPGSDIPPDHVFIDMKNKGLLDENYQLKPGVHIKKGANGWEGYMKDEQGNENVVYNEPTNKLAPDSGAKIVQGPDGITRDKATNQPLNGGTYRDPGSPEQYTYRDGKKVPLTQASGTMMKPGDTVSDLQPTPPTPAQVTGTEPLNQAIPGLSGQPQQAQPGQAPGAMQPATAAQPQGPADPGLKENEIFFDLEKMQWVDKNHNPIPGTTKDDKPITNPDGTITWMNEKTGQPTFPGTQPAQTAQPAGPPAPGTPEADALGGTPAQQQANREGGTVYNPATGTYDYVPKNQSEYIKQGPVATASGTSPAGQQPKEPPMPWETPTPIPDIPTGPQKTEEEYAKEFFSLIRNMFTIPERQTKREKGLNQASAFLALSNALTNAVNYGYAADGSGTPVIKTDNKYLFGALDEQKKLRDQFHGEEVQYKRDLQNAGLTAMGWARNAAESDKDRNFRANLAKAQWQISTAESAKERAFREEQANKLFGNQKEMQMLEFGQRKELTELQAMKQKELERFRHGLAMEELNAKLGSEEKQAILKQIFEAQKEAGKDAFGVVDINGNQYSMPSAVYWDVARGVIAGMNQQFLDNLMASDYNAQTNAIKLMVAEYWPKYFKVDAYGNWSRVGQATSPTGGIEQIIPPGMGGTTPGQAQEPIMWTTQP